MTSLRAWQEARAANIYPDFEGIWCLFESAYPLSLSLILYGENVISQTLTRKRTKLEATPDRNQSQSKSILYLRKPSWPFGSAPGPTWASPRPSRRPFCPRRISFRPRPQIASLLKVLFTLQSVKSQNWRSLATANARQPERSRTNRLFPATAVSRSVLFCRVLDHSTS